MAYTARNRALTDELVQIIAGYSPTSDAQAFKTCKDSASRNLRYHRFGRTNQFNVQSTLDGLVEKFLVLNNDPLASALDVRLKELAAKANKWTPEILSLFLQLSDRPADKARVEELDLIKATDPPPALTWNDIIADDPLTEKCLWEDIDYGVGSSDDETSAASRTFSDQTDSTLFSSTAEEEQLVDAETLIVQPDRITIDNIRRVQCWRSSTEASVKTSITEMQAIREVLHMLVGLPTSLFTFDKKIGNVVPNQVYSLKHASSLSFGSLLSSFADLGTCIETLRLYSRRRQRVCLLQTFSSTVADHIKDFEIAVSKIEKCFVILDGRTVVSLLSVHTDIQLHASFLVNLGELVNTLEQTSEDCPYHVMDELYDLTCASQAIGDYLKFESFGKVFFVCLQTYLKQVYRWMEGGQLDSQDDHFMIHLNDDHLSPATFWQARYSLRKAGGAVQAPRVFHSVTATILSAGKSVAFMKKLGMTGYIPSGQVMDQPQLTFEAVCHSNSFTSLTPFSFSFGQALNKWIQSKHCDTAALLRDHLLHNCGLWRRLDALETLYLSKNGSLFESLATSVFSKLDSGKAGWNNHFFLEGIVHSTFGEAATVEKTSISVHVHLGEPPVRRKSVQALTGFSLNYTYPWPIANIIPTSSILTYQSTFTLLLQIRRAKHLLAHQRLLKSLAPNFLSTPPNANQSTFATRLLAYSLRHRLLWFVITVEDYLITSAIAPASLELHTSMASAKDVDDMIAAHEHFIKRLESCVLLTEALKSVHTTLITALDLCVLFAELWSQQPSARSSAAAAKPMSDSGSDPENDHEADADAGGVEAVEPPISALNNTGNDRDVLPRLRQMRSQFHHLVALLIAGLRTAASRNASGPEGLKTKSASSRSRSGETAWEMLAERLEWGGVGVSVDVRE